MKIKQNPFANCTTLQHLDTDGWELKPSKMYNYTKGDAKMDVLSDADLKFLIDLRTELKFQENDGQADPRFWVVGDECQDIGIVSGFEHGKIFIDTDEGFSLGETVQEVISALIDREENLKIDDFKECVYLEDIIDVLNDKEIRCYELINYKNRHVIKEDTFFITKEACKDHIKQNLHHYRNPHPYAMTAWRSPQVERLYKILQNTDWENYKGE